MCPTIWFYLAEIYRIQDEHPEATLSMLADGMGVSLQAASRMIRRMVEEGLIIHEPYKGVTLTDEGTRIALMMLRQHRILEAYLVTNMGFGWDEVHEMTDNLERGMTPKIIQRMYELAGKPTRCPHGEPIPDENGIMPTVDDSPMPDWDEGQSARVSRVKTHDAEQLRYLADNHITPGTELTITGKSPFNGPIHIQLGHERVVLGYELAHEVRLETA